MLALLYDVHGNLPALEAVLEDARAAGAGRWVLGGDYSAFGGSPAAVFEPLAALADATWLRGNWERWAVEGVPRTELEQAVAVVRAALPEARRSQLAALPQRAAVDGWCCCHGSADSDVETLLPGPADDDDRLLEGIAETRVVVGHSHLPFTRRVGDRLVVNPGSVGLPLDGDPRAAYALVRDDGTVEHRRLEYDVERAAAAVRAAFADSPLRDRTLTALRTGSLPG